MKKLVFVAIAGCGGGKAKPAAPPPPAPEPAPAPVATADPAPVPAPAPAPAPPPTCKPGELVDGNECKDVATALQALRWEMPCKPHKGGDTCNAAVEKPTKSVTLAGTKGTTYDVTLHFRGEVEQNEYKGGSADGLWYTGGKSANTNYNIYKLEISDPPQAYYLNAGKAGIRHTWPLDYEKTLKIAGGATVTITGDAQDHALIVNQDDKKKPIVVADVPPAPEAFDGQFIQMDVTKVAPAK